MLTSSDSLSQHHIKSLKIIQNTFKLSKQRLALIKAAGLVPL